MTTTFKMTLAALTGALLVACGGDRPAKAPTDVPPPIDTPSPGDASGGASAPSAARAEIERGTKALESGDAAGAKAAFEEAVAKAPKDPAAHYYLGLALDRAGDKAGAEKSYKAALGLRADLEEAAQNLSALYIEGQRFAEAADVAKGALAKHAKNAGLALNLAVALSGKGDHDGAAKAFDDAAKAAPKDAMVLVTWGSHLGQWKKPDEAAQKLRAAEKLAGDDVGMLASIGFELKNVGAFPDCIGVLDRAIAKKPAAELLTYRSLCKYGAKDKAGALKDLHEAVAKEPKYAPAHYYLGGRLGEEGKLKEAAAEFQRYLDLEPNGPLAKAAQAKLKLAKDKAGKKK